MNDRDHRGEGDFTKISYVRQQMGFAQIFDEVIRENSIP